MPIKIKRKCSSFYILSLKQYKVLFLLFEAETSPSFELSPFIVSKGMGKVKHIFVFFYFKEELLTQSCVSIVVNGISRITIVKIHVERVTRICATVIRSCPKIIVPECAVQVF